MIPDFAQIKPARSGDVSAGLDRVRKGGEAPFHLLRRFQVAVHVTLAPEAELIDRGPRADRSHDVLQWPRFGRVIEDFPRSDTAHARLTRHGIKPVETGKIVRAATEGQRHIGAAAKDISQIGEVGERLAVRQVRHQDGDQTLGMVHNISPVEQAAAFAAACLAEREQAGQARPGGPVGRIEQQGAAVGEIYARARYHPDLGRLLRLPSAHYARHAAAVSKAKCLVAKQGSGREQLLGRGSAAQEGEVAGHLQLDIAGHQPNIPCMYQLKSPVCSFTPSPRRNSQKRSPPCVSTRK